MLSWAKLLSLERIRTKQFIGAGALPSHQAVQEGQVLGHFLFIELIGLKSGVRSCKERKLIVRSQLTRARPSLIRNILLPLHPNSSIITGNVQAVDSPVAMKLNPVKVPCVVPIASGSVVAPIDLSLQRRSRNICHVLNGEKSPATKSNKEPGEKPI